jgi:ribosomal protein S18 acetylase RimI-like enzyme
MPGVRGGGTGPAMCLALEIRELMPEDLSDLDWSGGPAHVAAVAAQVASTYQGHRVLLVGALPNARLVALGGVDLVRTPGTGWLWMLSVHEIFQGLGVGTMLVGALEARAVEAGCTRAAISVEHDNPRAARLYRRLGYREVGTELESWPGGGNRTYVTVCAVLEKQLA